MENPQSGSRESTASTRRTVLKALGAAGIVGATGAGISVTASSTPSAETAPTLEWLRRHDDTDGVETEWPYHSIVARDGGYVVAEDDLELRGVNEEGHRTWTNEFDQEDDGDMADMAELADGGFALVGWASPSSDPIETTPSYGFVIRVDDDLNRQWERRVDAGDDFEELLEWVIGTPDGGVLVAGGRVHLNDDENDENYHEKMLVKFSAAGDEEWRRVGDLEHEDGSPIEVSLDVTDDDGILLMTWDGLYSLHPDGSTEWSRSLADWMPGAAVATPDGGAVLAASTSDGPNTFGVVSFDDQGSVQWHETYEDDVPGHEEQIARHEDGFVVAGDTAGGDGEEGDYVVMGVGPDGSYQWHTTFGDPDWNERCRSGDLLVDGDSYVLGGFAQAWSDDVDDGSVLAKLTDTAGDGGDDSDGDGDGGTTTETESETTTETTSETTTDTTSTDTTGTETTTSDETTTTTLPPGDC